MENIKASCDDFKSEVKPCSATTSKESPDLLFSLFGRSLASLSPYSLTSVPVTPKKTRSFNPDSDEPYSIYQERKKLLTTKPQVNKDVASPDKIRSFLHILPSVLQLVSTVAAKREGRSGLVIKSDPSLPDLNADLKDLNAINTEQKAADPDAEGDLMTSGSHIRVSKKRLENDVAEPEDTLMDILKTGKAKKKGFLEQLDEEDIKEFKAFDYRNKKKQESQERTFWFYGRAAWKYARHILKVFWKTMEKEQFDRKIVLGPFAEDVKK
jgi:hypothetical protein